MQNTAQTSLPFSTPPSELDNVRQAYIKAYTQATQGTVLMAEHIIFLKAIFQGDFTVKLTVMFTPHTTGGLTSYIPSFTLYNWPKGKMSGDSTELGTVSVDEAYNAAIDKLENYSTGSKAKRAAAAQAVQAANIENAQPDLTIFGGDDTTGDNDPDAPLPPKTQRTIMNLRMMDHLRYLCDQHKGNWFELNRSDSRRIPHLFGLPLGSVTLGAGPDCISKAHGYRLERKAQKGNAPRSYGYWYRLTQIDERPLPSEPEVTLVQPNTPNTPNTAPAVQVQVPSFLEALTAVEQTVQALRQAYNQIEAETSDRIRQAVKDALVVAEDHHKEQLAEAEANYNMLTTKLNNQIDTLTKQLEQAEAKQARLRSLLDA